MLLVYYSNVSRCVSVL